MVVFFEIKFVVDLHVKAYVAKCEQIQKQNVVYQKWQQIMQTYRYHLDQEAEVFINRNEVCNFQNGKDDQQKLHKLRHVETIITHIVEQVIHFLDEGEPEHEKLQ